jgi:hypothetical protein
MKTLLSIALFCSVAPLLHAEDCVKLEEKAEQKEVQIIPRWGMKVIAPTRVYFHSAPSNACKIKDLFMIKNDHITAIAPMMMAKNSGFRSCISASVWETRFKVGQN